MQPPDSPQREPMTPKPIQMSQPSSPSKISQASPPSSPSRISRAQLSFSTNNHQGSQRSSTQKPQGSPQLPTQTPYEYPHLDKQVSQKSSSSKQSTPSPGNVPLSYTPPPPNQTPTNTTSTKADWSTGLCACHSDITNCCITSFCPCITFGQITDIVDKGTSSCVINGTVYAVLAVVLGCACFYSAIYRRKMRLQFNLKGNNLEDCCVHSCCEICALAQEYRELQLRGFDLGLGWQGSIDRQNQGAITTPPPTESMKR